MRLKALILTIALTALALANQAGFKLERHYKQGDKDSYAMTMNMAMGGGMAVDMKMDLTQTVKKVYENGDADVESAVGEMEINAMGQNMKRPGGPASVVRLTKYGTPVGNTGSKGMATFMTYSSVFGDKEMKVGETYPVNVSDPAKPEEKVVGTIKVDSIENGVAKILSKMDVTQKGMTKPMHIDSTTLVDVASSKPNRIDGTVTGVAFGGPGTPNVESVKFTFERKK